MRTPLLIALTLTIGVGLGTISSWYSIENRLGFGSLTIGQWTAWPASGSSDADPYTKAKVARDGAIPLGAAEGLAFTARMDEAGEILLRECQYSIAGNTPTARLWTLAAYDEKDEQVPPIATASGVAFSRSLLRKPDGSFELQVGPMPSMGGWISTTGSGQMHLVLRLYDTPITGSAGLLNADMPRVVKMECNS